MKLTRTLKQVVVPALIAGVLGGCVHSPYTEEKESKTKPAPPTENEGRYSQRHDSGPDQSYSVDHIPNAVPKVEEIRRAGNKSPYKIAGRTYHVLPSAKGYKETGYASWYGKKFHGHATANGEIYDMYGMTAAHKSLPIPSYVEVTNVANGRSIIVRVNDRGPFHGNRIIDLTYTAAKKLGFVDAGTAKVKVVAIDPQQWQRKNAGNVQTPAPVLATSGEPPAPSPKNAEGHNLPENTYLQVGAFSSHNAAENHRRQVTALTGASVLVQKPDQNGSLYRVRIGPILDSLQLSSIRALLAKGNLNSHHLVYD
ncbi:septal ring lytic transglycosylase RlpA family protein [Sessilibacter corallicola]|uniref:septal ring lytic transglycosylase RlpA family protein n=1 Tax=Sessilibacter corallicola TaxID=2904075 RepID=UPI0025747548|nr:septal ring lytic transglycosylase RlpA family protein [Sessilibacter corallicola]